MKKNVPLCIDLDGTLVATDTLWEAVMVTLKTKPSLLLKLPFWLTQGKASMKHRLTEIIAIDVHNLPYRENVLAYAKQEKAKGRKLILATAADSRVAQAVAKHLGIFSEVIASEGKINITSRAKARALVKRYGEKGFDYAGNERRDLPVWEKAREVIVVSASPGVLTAAEKIGNVTQVFGENESYWQALWRQLRPHQWIKNILVFVPVIMAHRWQEPKLFLAALYAWLALSATASALYIFNDLLDLSADRQHSAKRHRPLASGKLPISWGLVAMPLLLAVSVWISLTLLPMRFSPILLAYALGSAAYSFVLKQVPIIDVIFLSGLYTLRLIAGARATDVIVSFWLLAFAIFFFLSLALIKRYAELQNLATANGRKVKGRGYLVGDAEMLASLGGASGYMSVLVLALYMDSHEVKALYHNPAFLWVICPLLLYWISRLWFLARRGLIHEDPIIFAAKDQVSYLIGVITALLMMLAV
jgi:4-hydroxybenzoate polyprenyltransferase/phosphoserine phosphatase